MLCLQLLTCFSFYRKKLQFIDPRGYVNIAWLFFQALIFLYNAWVIPLRAIFPFARTSLHPFLWLSCKLTHPSIGQRSLCPLVNLSKSI